MAVCHDFSSVIGGRQAELMGNSVQKGQRLLVEGRLQIRQYIVKCNGEKLRPSSHGVVTAVATFLFWILVVSKKNNKK